MKKNYIAPQSYSYSLLWENGVALNILSGENNSNSVTLDDDADILSNKKENPVWNDKKGSGMWDGMKD